MRQVETTYLEYAQGMQPHRNVSKCSCGVHRTRCRCDQTKIKSKKLKIERISVNQAGEDKTTYHRHTQTMQPHGYHSKRCQEAYRPSRQCSRIKTEPTNVSRTCEDGNTYHKCIIAIRSIQRPKKGIKRLEELTFEYRMPGEPWRNIDDHG